MSNLPITSRIKRSPLLLEYIDQENPNVIVGGTIKGDPTTSTETITTKRKPTGVSYEDAYKKADKTKYPTFESFKDAAIAYNKENDTVTETKTTVTPGEQTVWEGTIKEETKGDVFQPWETRQMSRSIKKEQRDIRRSKQKLDKANKRGNTIKAEEAQAELEEFQAMATRNKAARASGKKGGSEDVTTGQTDKLQGKLTKEQQEKMLAEKAARDAGVITAKKEEQEKIRKEGEAGRDADDAARKNKTGIYAPKESYPAGMKPSAFKMYAKSPATKKLQGAQNTLPQQLQDAIKAAPGKMKSPMKKGYFKKY